MSIKEKYIIGIDPGTKTGLAVWDRQEKKILLLLTCDILQAVDNIRTYNSEFPNDIFVRIEDPHKRKWYGSNATARIQGAGSVKRDFKIIRDELERLDIPYDAYDPKTVRTKVSPQFFKKLTGWSKRCSVHARDAAMSVIGM